MENQKRIYAQGVYVTEKQTKSGLSFMEVNFQADKFIEWALQNKDDKGYVKTTFWKKKEGTDTKYGTHSVELNQWQPPAQTQKSRENRSGNPFMDSPDNFLPDGQDLPF
jgi:hypothetical protein